MNRYLGIQPGYGRLIYPRSLETVGKQSRRTHLFEESEQLTSAVINEPESASWDGKRSFGWSSRTIGE